MSETPPPIADDPAAPSSTNIDIDLGEDINLSASPEHKDDSIANLSKPQVLSDDLFFSAIAEPAASETSRHHEDMDEIFTSNRPTTTREVRLDDDDENGPFSTSKLNGSIAAVAATASIATENAKVPHTDDTPKLSSFPSVKPSLTTSNSVYGAIEEDEEETDKFLEITLSDPSKVGDGMGSYMVYKILTKTNIPAFKSQEFSTSRRFSDFLNLYEKLKEKHLPSGRILPPAPEKDMIGMAKIKMSKEDATPGDFIEKRKHALQRFINRLAKHKTFRYDPDFRDFLEIADGLPKATNTSALSGAGMMKMFKNVTDSVSKISLKMEESDQWFEEKSRQVENLYIQYKKMHNATETMYGWRKDLAASAKEFGKHLNILASSEEQLSLSRALSQLSDIYDKIDSIYVEQSNSDYFVLSELVKDYVCLFENIREVFYQRVKTFNSWQKTEELLRTKREAKTKLEASNKQDKIPTVAAEIRDLEIKVEKGKEDFEQISKTIKEEIRRFDLNRAKEFRNELTNYLQSLLVNHETVVKIWEQYLPEVKAI